MSDYSFGKIYRLTCADQDKCYYGSTSYTLGERFSHHKSAYKAWKDGKSKKYCSSYKLFEIGEVEIDLVMNCPCETKRELVEIEEVYRENDPEAVNAVRCFMPDEERKEKTRNYFNNSHASPLAWLRRARR